MKLSRRTFSSLALSGAALSALPGHALPFQVRGVRVGLITGSLNPLPERAGVDPIDIIIEQCRDLDVQDVELVSVYAQGQPDVVDFIDRAAGRFGQPPPVRSPAYVSSRQALREWRLAQPLDRFQAVRAKFRAAGMNVFSYVQTIDDDMADDEMDAIFRQMRALGVTMFTTNQTRVSMGPRMAPFCEKYRIQAAWHPHDKTQDPNEVATAETMEKLLAISRAFAINLDIGHFVAGNGDAVGFLKKHHARITHLHIKDRRRDHGPRVLLGTGDTPIAECVKLVRDHHWPIRIIIEREFADPARSSLEQTRWELDYVRRILAG